MENKKTNGLSYLSYAWTVIVNIFIVFVVLAIFSSVYGDFETIIISIAVLIYLNLNSFAALWGWQKQQELFALNDEFKKIRALLKEKIDEDDEEYEKEQLENSKNKFKKQQVKFYINIGFAFLIYIIALLNLFGAL